ncbi:MAG: site-specific integrase [Candidatus Krumholzibacteriales bacterium]
MGKIRDLMIEQLRLRNYSRQTIRAYLLQIRGLVRFTAKSPDQITEQDLRNYFRHLVYVRQVSTSYRNQAVSAVKFLYRHVLKSPVVIAGIPRPKREYKLPAVLSVEEVMRMFSLVRNRKHLAIMVP